MTSYNIPLNCDDVPSNPYGVYSLVPTQPGNEANSGVSDRQAWFPHSLGMRLTQVLAIDRLVSRMNGLILHHQRVSYEFVLRIVVQKASTFL